MLKLALQHQKDSTPKGDKAIREQVPRIKELLASLPKGDDRNLEHGVDLEIVPAKRAVQLEQSVEQKTDMIGVHVVFF